MFNNMQYSLKYETAKQNKIHFSFLLNVVIFYSLFKHNIGLFCVNNGKQTVVNIQF